MSGRRRNNFGKGKTRVCLNWFVDNKTGRDKLYLNGRWVDVTELYKDLDDLFEPIFGKEIYDRPHPNNDVEET